MSLNITYRRGIILTLILSFLIPLFVIIFKLISSGEDSIVLRFNSTLGILLIVYYSFIIFVGLFYILKWITNQFLLVKSLKNEKVSAELMHLKSQVNPHFFFNMLNNLYGWIDKDTSVAKDIVITLSDMMRYSIYKGQEDKVKLNEEIEFIKNFTALNKKRYHKNIYIELTIDVIDNELEVMPLLFIVLVENAFKHGVEHLRENAFVHISMSAENKKIDFEVKNNFDKNIKTTPGIGLKNLKQRLEIVYPNKHTFSYKIEDNLYIARLTLDVI